MRKGRARFAAAPDARSGSKVRGPKVEDRRPRPGCGPRNAASTRYIRFVGAERSTSRCAGGQFRVRSTVPLSGSVHRLAGNSRTLFPRERTRKHPGEKHNKVFSRGAYGFGGSATLDRLRASGRSTTEQTDWVFSPDGICLASGVARTIDALTTAPKSSRRALREVAANNLNPGEAVSIP